jgi:hypothetical protein
MLQMLHFIGSLAALRRVKCSGTQPERRPQVFKKLAVLIAALAVSAPAFADRGHHRGHGHRHVAHHYHVKHRPVVHHYHVRHRPVVHHYHYPYYRPAPRPVYVVERPHYNGAALLAGAVIGAAIVHHATMGY